MTYSDINVKGLLWIILDQYKKLPDPVRDRSLLNSIINSFTSVEYCLLIDLVHSGRLNSLVL